MSTLYGGNMPDITRHGETPGPRALYHSRPEQALILTKTLAPGYGPLKVGTLLSRNASADGNAGMLVPYVMDDASLNDQIGVAYAVASVANGSNSISVTLEDSYRFVVGDDLILGRNNGGDWEVHNAGAITVIDRITSPNIAIITFTAAAPNANFTTGNFAGCWVESGTNPDKLCDAAYVLDQDVDTGVGEFANGSLTSVVVSNAILNIGPMMNQNYDAQGGVTDLGGVLDGQYFILR